MGEHFDYENILGALGLQLMVVRSASVCEAPVFSPQD